MKLSVIGGGAWGTALAHVFSVRHEVLVYERNPRKVELINKGIYPADTSLRISPKVRATDSWEEILSFGDVFILSVPTQAVREVLGRFPKGFSKPVINTAKGLEISTFKTVSEIFAEFFPKENYFVLSGPSFAREVVLGKPTAVVLSGFDKTKVVRFQNGLNLPGFRIYRNPDTKGVELGGALKNVMAIAVGICDGLDLGLNARSALITRSLKEMADIGEVWGAKRETFYGLSGLGDLVLTATGDLSRNRTFGVLIGKGTPVEEALRKLKTVEGYYTAEALYRMAKLKKLELPITETVYEVLYKNLSPEEAARRLMSRTPKEE
jgi:glycerol-3-phosphate dehydrogenase (NAD(P)+)